MASIRSGGSALGIKSRYGADFPTCVDLAGITHGLYGVGSSSSIAYVVGEDGKIEKAFDLYYLGARLPGIVAGAKDPFGIDAVPAQCADAYKALKYGQYALAARMAKVLARSSDAEVQATATKIGAAADQYEADWLKRMEALAVDGAAGKLHDETVAYLASYPRSRKKGTLVGYQNKARYKGNGKKESLAAANFQRAMQSFTSNRTSGTRLLEAIATQLRATHHGEVSAAIIAAMNGR